ncbi:MAG TPA: hypothetical protein VHF92_01480, partial [Geodermatophilus sp.]|nr:hypothetical protein [Geodermatophilus sp.]
VAVTVLSAGFHEFGHAAAARYGGATPGAMGFGIYLFWPAFYTDVTDSYRLGRAGRVRTDLGGLYFNALVVLGTFGVWALTGWHAVLLVVATQVLQMVRQLAPLLRFDGYHVLADLTGVPDLYQRIGPVLSGLLPGRWHQPGATALKTWARVVVIVWVLLVVPLMAASLLLLVLALPRVLATAWASLRRQGGLASEAFGDGDFLEVLARGVGMLAVVVPLLGVGYVVLRLVRRTALAVWRRTEGRPVRRAVACLVAAALVAGLGWAWWPGGDRYRPVQAFEGGTVLDALPAARGTSSEAAVGGGLTVWPEDAGQLPTADDPALALVLVPSAPAVAAGAGAGEEVEEGGGATEPAPTWVFPFDRPLPPGEGDNQALAVNTRDGSVRYDVSFALVWADDGAVVNRNEAYAFASCTGCRTVAVGFQVVLVLGSVDVVVPQNVAAAVNYACLECVTYALATQLVVALPGALGEEGSAELAAIWEELRAFGESIEGVPLSELRARLTEYEARILAVVREHAAEESPAAGEPSEAPGAGTGSEPTTTGPQGEADPQEAPATTEEATPTFPASEPGGSSATSSTTAEAPVTSSSAPTTTAPGTPAAATTAAPSG